MPADAQSAEIDARMAGARALSDRAWRDLLCERAAAGPKR